MPITLTPLRYPGGKSQLTPFVVELLKANGLLSGEYCEPFAGGAGIACSLLLNGHVTRIHINDLDRSIYAFWWCVLNDTERFCDRIESVKLSIDTWKRQRTIQRTEKRDLFALGFSTFFLNRTNRSGIIDGGVIGGLEQTGDWLIDCRFNREDLARKVRRIAAHGEQIELTNLDGKALLHQLNRRANPESLLVNIDPPYFLKGRELYKNWYGAEDHAALASAVAQIRPRWMVTYDDTPETRSLYSTFRCYNQQLNYSAQVKRVGVELLVLDRRLKLPTTYFAEGEAA
jgi:DNA adenine methylase